LGVSGALLLATRASYSRYGWLLFLASNFCWLAHAHARGDVWLLAQQLAFTATSLLGVWRWLLQPQRCARFDLPPAGLAKQIARLIRRGARHGG
jgi:hypothetical protein